VPAIVSVVEVIKNAEVDLRLGITSDGRIVVVIREVVQCALLKSERGAQRFLSMQRCVACVHAQHQPFSAARAQELGQ
jgi:hypothetical protein